MNPSVVTLSVIGKFPVGEPEPAPPPGRKRLERIEMFARRPTGETITRATFAYTQAEAEFRTAKRTESLECWSAGPPLTAGDYELVVAELRSRVDRVTLPTQSGRP